MPDKTRYDEYQDWLKKTYPQRMERIRLEKEQELMQDPYEWGKYCARKALDEIFGDNDA